MHQERDVSRPGRSPPTLRNPDFAAYARAFGGHGETVEETAEFLPAFERALASRPAVDHPRQGRSRRDHAGDDARAPSARRRGSAPAGRAPHADIVSFRHTHGASRLPLRSVTFCAARSQNVRDTVPFSPSTLSPRRGTIDAAGLIERERIATTMNNDTAAAITWADALAALGDIVNPSREVLTWASANWDDASTWLIGRLGDFASGRRDEISGSEAFYIAHLCGEKRETRAYPILCRLIAEDAGIAEWLDDAVTETLPGVLISVFDGDTVPLRRAIESARGDEFARASALSALGYLVRARLRDERRRHARLSSPYSSRRPAAPRLGLLDDLGLDGRQPRLRGHGRRDRQAPIGRLHSRRRFRLLGVQVAGLRSPGPTPRVSRVSRSITSRRSKTRRPRFCSSPAPRPPATPVVCATS